MTVSSDSLVGKQSASQLEKIRPVQVNEAFTLIKENWDSREKPMRPELEKRLEYLDGLTDAHLKLFGALIQGDGGKLFPLDILAAATIKRSLALTQGIRSLIRASNYTCAASLIRLQLDSCLRLFAAFIVKKPHDLAHNVLKGEPIRRMEDRDGNRMTDRHLVETLASKYDWLPKMYNETSGFIHLSEKHLHLIFDGVVEEEHSVGMRISADDEHLPLESWIELVDGFEAVTNILFEYLTGWVVTKDNPEAVAKLREEIKSS